MNVSAELSARWRAEDEWLKAEMDSARIDLDAPRRQVVAHRRWVLEAWAFLERAGHAVGDVVRPALREQWSRAPHRFLSFLTLFAMSAWTLFTLGFVAGRL